MPTSPCRWRGSQARPRAETGAPPPTPPPRAPGGPAPPRVSGPGAPPGAAPARDALPRPVRAPLCPPPTRWPPVAFLPPLPAQITPQGRPPAPGFFPPPGPGRPAPGGRRSVDTKKKELVGPFKNGGRAWRPTKTPQRVRAHDFVIPGAGGKAIPYGVYDPHRNEGRVSVGIDHDMATFAVRSIRRWWQHMRRPVYRDAVTLLITADAGPTASTARRSRSARSFCSTSAVQPDKCPRHVDQGAREAAAYHRGDESGASQWPTAEAPAAKTHAAASRE